MYITLEIYVLHKKDIVKEVDPIYTRFLYVHAHVHVHAHGLTLTSHGFFQCGRSAGTESCRWLLGREVHKLQQKGFHQID